MVPSGVLICADGATQTGIKNTEGRTLVQLRHIVQLGIAFLKIGKRRGQGGLSLIILESANSLGLESVSRVHR